MAMYPYFFFDGITPMGYCQVIDVEARIKQGGYNPDVPGGITSEYIQQYILQAAAQIDMVLAKTGYTLPLTPLVNTLPIGPQAFTFLLNVNAIGAAGYIELWRHAEDVSNADSQAQRLLSLFDDLLARLETGDDNLALFNVAGPWPPEADPAQSMDDGTGDMDPITGIIPIPQFTIIPNQERDSPSNPLLVW